MSNFKHFEVLHKPSDKIVSIFKFTTDATWKGKEREELIAIPADTPKEINEIQMCFTKAFKRYEGTNKEQKVTDFFKRKSGQPETLSERRSGGEGEAHKLAKNEIYIKLYNEELTINGKTIYELGIKDLRISEEEHSDTGHSIADIFVHFGKYPNHHPTYDLGIDIEIQFSPQNKGRTKERTHSRLREGWSVIWLWKDDFDENGKLKFTNLKCLPREEQLKELNEEEYTNNLKRMNEIGTLIDDKIKFGREEIKEELANSKERINHNSENQIRKIKELLIEIPKEKVSEELNKLMNKDIISSKIISLFGEDIINGLKNELQQEVQNQKKDLFDDYSKMLKNLKEGINYNEIKLEILNKLKEDENLLEDFGDIFIKLKLEELMKKVKDSFPLYVRDFMLSHLDDCIINFYEDKFGDIKRRLNEIKGVKEIYGPNKRLLVENGFQSKGYKDKIYPIENIKQEKISSEDDKKNS